MQKVSLGKLIENIVENKYKNKKEISIYQSLTKSHSGKIKILTGKKLNLIDYYKFFEQNQVGMHTTYNLVGKQDYSKIDNLLKNV